MTGGRQWRSLGVLTDAPVLGRSPTAAERLISWREQQRRRHEIGLSSKGYDPDDPLGDPEMSVDPESVAFGGRIPRRGRALKATERPFKEAVDAWLARDGWRRGEAGKASVSVQWVAPPPGVKESAEKRRIINRWRAELKARHWNPAGGELEVTSRFVNYSDGRQRMFWWTTPSAAARGRPLCDPPGPARRSSRPVRRRGPGNPVPDAELYDGLPDDAEVDD